jgi:hypothetical protein
VTIHQKIWDESDNLIRDKVTEKELSPNVVIVGSDSTSNEPVEQVIEPAETPVDKDVVEEPVMNKEPLSEPVEETPATTDNEVNEDEEDKLVEELSNATEKETGALVEMVRKQENLQSVDRVYVGNEVGSEDSVQVTIEGRKAHRLLGLFEITTPAKLTYDADSWQLVEKEQSLTQKIVEFLSLN